jgi:hypothetical protein
MPYLAKPHPAAPYPALPCYYAKPDRATPRFTLPHPAQPSPATMPRLAHPDLAPPNPTIPRYSASPCPAVPDQTIPHPTRPCLAQPCPSRPYYSALLLRVTIPAPQVLHTDMRLLIFLIFFFSPQDQHFITPPFTIPDLHIKRIENFKSR